MLKQELTLNLLFLTGCATNQTNQLIIIDEANSHPIESAWIYLADENIEQ
ncbi:hypothetical protein KKF86_08735 [bacterium]|nr:hypothetical protein [bacterium]